MVYAICVLSNISLPSPRLQRFSHMIAPQNLIVLAFMLSQWSTLNQLIVYGEGDGRISILNMDINC